MIQPHQISRHQVGGEYLLERTMLDTSGWVAFSLSVAMFAFRWMACATCKLLHGRSLSKGIFVQPGNFHCGTFEGFSCGHRFNRHVWVKAPIRTWFEKTPPYRCLEMVWKLGLPVGSSDGNR